MAQGIIIALFSQEQMLTKYGCVWDEKTLTSRRKREKEVQFNFNYNCLSTVQKKAVRNVIGNRNKHKGTLSKLWQPWFQYKICAIYRIGNNAHTKTRVWFLSKVQVQWIFGVVVNKGLFAWPLLDQKEFVSSKHFIEKNRKENNLKICYQKSCKISRNSGASNSWAQMAQGIIIALFFSRTDANKTWLCLRWKNTYKQKETGKGSSI